MRHSGAGEGEVQRFCQRQGAQQKADNQLADQEYLHYFSKEAETLIKLS